MAIRVEKFSVRSGVKQSLFGVLRASFKIIDGHFV